MPFPGCLADSELPAQLLRRRDHELVKLMERCTVRLDSAFAIDAKLPYRLDDAGGQLRDGRRLTGERHPRRRLGVDRVALAAPAAAVRVRPVDLDDADASRVQMPDERRGGGAGRLDADDGDLAEVFEPRQQLLVAAGVGRERGAAQ